MSDKLSNIIDTICNAGCSSVNAVIDSLEKGDSISTSEPLSSAERIQLIKELKEIMLIYNNK